RLGVAASPPAHRLHPRHHARRLPVRQRHVQERGAGPAGGHRGLGDGHRGRPKLDLGWMVQAWPDDPGAPEEASFSYVDMVGIPTRDQVVAHYAEVSGRQVDDIDYYVLLAKWKLAIVLERGFQRAGDDEKLQAFGPVVIDLMRSAADLADTTDYGR